MSDSFKCLFLALAAIVVWVGQPVSPLAACQAEPARPMVRVTEAFRLSIHTESERVADQAREVAEKTWEIASDVYGATLPNKRLKVCCIGRRPTYIVSKMWPVSPKTIPDTMLALCHQPEAGGDAGFAAVFAILFR